ncbi:MAG: metallophosphoesterase family protein [Candidatus Baldrarchaeia archaeon]
MVLIGATGDIHSPKYFQLFKEALEKTEIDKLDILIFTGDIIYKGKINELKNILKILNDFEVKCPIISVFGNEEFEPLHNKIREMTSGKIKFLEDEFLEIKIGGKTLGIVGSKGSLDKPTTWQARNIPNIKEIYNERVNKVDELLGKLSTDFKILVLHYAPTYKTLKGEKPEIYPFLGCKKYEKAITKRHPDIVIHGHSHNGTPKDYIGNIPVYNVALPLVKKIVTIKLPFKTSLEHFFTKRR